MQYKAKVGTLYHCDSPFAYFIYLDNRNIILRLALAGLIAAKLSKPSLFPYSWAIVFIPIWMMFLLPLIDLIVTFVEDCCHPTSSNTTEGGEEQRFLNDDHVDAAYDPKVSGKGLLAYSGFLFLPFGIAFILLALKLDATLSFSIGMLFVPIFAGCCLTCCVMALTGIAEENPLGASATDKAEKQV